MTTLLEAREVTKSFGGGLLDRRHTVALRQAAEARDVVGNPQHAVRILARADDRSGHRDAFEPGRRVRSSEDARRRAHEQTATAIAEQPLNRIVSRMLVKRHVVPLAVTKSGDAGARADPQDAVAILHQANHAASGHIAAFGEVRRGPVADARHAAGTVPNP